MFIIKLLVNYYDFLLFFFYIQLYNTDTVSHNTDMEYHLKQEQLYY